MSTGVRARIILNDASGGAAGAAGGAIDEACGRAGVDARVIRVTRSGILEAAEPTAADEVLVAAGGDGTVSTLATVAVTKNLTFGIIPLGTLNHFARDAGIPQELDRAVATIAGGRMRRFDVGEVNNVIFLNNASLGMYPRLVWERQLEETHGRAKWAAFAIALARGWRGYRTINVQMTVDGLALRRQTPFVFVGNGDYRAEGLDLGTRAALDSGRLSMFVAPGITRMQALMLPFRALTRQLPSDGLFEAFRAHQISIDGMRPEVGMALDGEIVLVSVPLHFAVRPRVLRMLVPQDT